MLHNATQCYTMLHNATQCYTMLHYFLRGAPDVQHGGLAEEGAAGRHHLLPRPAWAHLRLFGPV